MMHVCWFKYMSDVYPQVIQNTEIFRALKLLVLMNTQNDVFVAGYSQIFIGGFRNMLFTELALL